MHRDLFLKGGTMSRRSIRVVFPESLHLQAVPAVAESVGLGRPIDASEYRVFVIMTPPNAPHGADVVHLSVDNARYLRDAIDAVLEEHQAMVSDTI
jgi:hypothetical protein